MAELTVAEAIRDALAEEMRRDPEVFVMGEDVGQFGGVFKNLKGLFEEFGPDRVRDTPISEAAIVGAGVGAAMLGAPPVVEIMFIDFATVCMDMIVNQAAKIRWKSAGQFAVPLVIRTQGGCGQIGELQPVAVPRGLVRPRPGPQGRRAERAGRLQGPAQDGRP